jgi:TnpA family transposase
MTAIDRTAYPQLSRQLSDDELTASYTLSKPELIFIKRNSRSDRGALVLSAILKGRQHLGYFPALANISSQVETHLAHQLGVSDVLPDDLNYRTSLHRYRSACRELLDSVPFTDDGVDHIVSRIQESALTMSDPADLINVAIEELVKSKIELPAFSTLDRIAIRERQYVHDQLYNSITNSLSQDQQNSLDSLLVVQDGKHITEFARMKQTPGPATLSHFRKWADRLMELDSIFDPKPFLDDIAFTKIRQFSAQARAYEISDMRGIASQAKRHTLLLSLLWSAQSKTRDELIDMFLRRMKRIHHSAKAKLQDLQQRHRELEESLIGVLGQVLQQAKGSDANESLGLKVAFVLNEHGGVDALNEKISRVSAYHDNNYLPLIWAVHTSNRAVIFRVLDQIKIESATQDDRLMTALNFIKDHRASRKELLPAVLDIQFMSGRWRSFIQVKEEGLIQLNRHALEVAVFTHLAEALQGGDFYIEDSEAYSDYRKQLLPWSTCQERIEEYCDSIDLPATKNEFVGALKEELAALANQIDQQFPENSEFTIDPDGTPHLKRQPATSKASNEQSFKDDVYSRMPGRHLLDVLKCVQHWTNYSKHFRPPSGSDTKISESATRYLFTVFGYGCNLGASQTARHAPESIHRQTLRRINMQHINAEKLEAALSDVIGEYARFELPKHWGSRRVAIADGTQIPLRKNNLLGEQHIRYGGYGGIAYHHVSGEYIALFSHFIACGVWEAVYILDALLLNKSVYQPDTLHADTHGQSEPVFALAHLLGIKLFPRMRTWNDVAFYKPDRQTRYTHIEPLFTKTVDWKLIEIHWQDMMQVVLSIQAGKVLPSMLLRKLNSHNRKNKLYRAFRELGRVIRTLFLLRYVSEGEFRQTIRAETTKVESYNDFTDWITFGGDLIKSGDPVEQSKQVKYTNLIANSIMLQNVVDLTTILNEMAGEEIGVSKELVASLSPYIRDHIRRFGRYDVNMEEFPTDLDPKPVKLTA